MSFPGIQVSVDADQLPREWLKPWEGEAFPLFLHAASLDSTLLVTAPGEELSSFFPEAEMEIEDGRTEQAHGKFLTHSRGVSPRAQAVQAQISASHWRRVPRREVKEKQTTTLQISSQLFAVSL